jgi:hypothetical protein
MLTPTLRQPQRFCLALLLALFASPTTACVDTEPTASGTGGSATMTGGAGGSAGAPAGGGSGAGPAGASGSSTSGQGGGGTSAGVGGSLPAGASGTGTSGVGGAAGAAPGGSGGSTAGSGGAAATGGASGTAGAGGVNGGAGGAAGTGGGGTGGASAYNPCPATGPCKILPLGDSITDGFGTPGGYRIELFHLTLQGQKTITFVGGSMNGPTMVDGQMFPRAHEGHSGWTIMQIDGIVPSPALGVDPHIVLLHIGTNDINGNATGAPGRLSTLLDQIIADSPDALLVVAQIVPLRGRNTQIETFNAAIPAMVTQRANMGRHIVLVDQYTGFPDSELADGVHPSPAGYARMAGVWYRAISSYLR